MSGCYLLDTHALLWATGTPAKLSKEARKRLEEESARILVSHATIWEMSIKWTIGKIKLPDGYFESLENNGFEIMPMTDAHFSAYRALPLLHRDPFDRMLVAQAQSEDLPLLSADTKISAYDVNVLW